MLNHAMLYVWIIYAGSGMMITLSFRRQVVNASSISYSFLVVITVAALITVNAFNNSVCRLPSARLSFIRRLFRDIFP